VCPCLRAFVLHSETGELTAVTVLKKNMDLVGNVWQWTNEFQDDHTRAAILRGGSAYQPHGSFWYFPQAYRNDQHAKLLLMAPARDRSGEIGFRCAADPQAILTVHSQAGANSYARTTKRTMR
jgi:formylglycine-generating enzyme required for sulfatase activity